MLENELDAEKLGAALDASDVQVTNQSHERDDEKSLKDEILANLKTVNERPRDPVTKRFIKADPEPQQQERGAANEQQSQQKQQPAEQDKTPGQQPAKQEPSAQPPTSWSAEAKGEFTNLPRSVQDAIAKREAEVHRGFTAQDEDRNYGKQLRDVASPYMPIIQAEGGDVVTAFRSLLNSAYVLRQGSPEQKSALVNDLINRYNIPLEGITASPPNPQDPVTPQPRPGLTEDQVRQIAAETTQAATVQATIAAFAADPANKHFQQVKAHMSALLVGGLANSLKDAYDQACRAHPEISSSLAAEANAKAEEQRQKSIRDKATAAKHAGGSVTGGPGASTPPQKSSQPERELRDEIAHNLALITQQRV